MERLSCHTSLAFWNVETTAAHVCWLDSNMSRASKVPPAPQKHPILGCHLPASLEAKIIRVLPPGIAGGGRIRGEVRRPSHL